MKINTAQKVYTHNGAPAVAETAYERLKRTVMACMLFEDNFYEDGMAVADRIVELCRECTTQQILELAMVAATRHKLRHVPLKMIVEALKKTNHKTVAPAITTIITRPDMMTDLLALYWKEGKRPLAHQLKKGLAKAFVKFDEYQLAKYDRDNPIKIRDVMFLTRPKPLNKEQEELFKRVASRTMKTPDTWEVRLSAGEDKKESFQELLTKNKMGKLAIIRNLRNMKAAGIEKALINEKLSKPDERGLLPFQFIAAAKAVPEWEDIIDAAMIQSCHNLPLLPGVTILLVDVSGSMDSPLSVKSEMTMLEAACGVAILLREVCGEVYVLSFSNACINVPPRRGMALRDAIVKSQQHSGTYLGACLEYVLKQNAKFDRMIVITDEQTHDVLPKMPKTKNYIINIAPYQNGIGQKDSWITISGFSEACVDFIREYEQSSMENA